jgi:hypothetical protein
LTLEFVIRKTKQKDGKELFLIRCKGGKLLLLLLLLVVVVVVVVVAAVVRGLLLLFVRLIIIFLLLHQTIHISIYRLSFAATL